MKVIQILIVLTISFAKLKLNVGDEDEMVEETQPFTFNYSTRNDYISVNSEDSILLVGDSRTVGLHNATQNEDLSYIAKVSMGYNWLVDGTSKYNTSELIENYLESSPTGTVVFNLGVNDLYQKGNYCYYIEELTTNHPEATICYLSVNPTSKSYSNLNSQIDDFNNYLIKNLPENVIWIDSNSYLTGSGFYAPDGLHYDSITYEKIQDLILESL